MQYLPEQTHYAMYNGSKYHFIEPPSNTLLCQECKDIPYEPHQMPCCHSLFCKKCITLSTCTKCYVHGKAVPDLRSNKLIQELTVWCPNSFAGGLGCEWKGRLGEVPHHRNVCPRELISCLYGVVGCEEKLHRNKMKNHERENRDAHLNLAMKKVVSLSTTVNDLQERVKLLDELQKSIEQLEMDVKELKEHSLLYN